MKRYEIEIHELRWDILKYPKPELWREDRAITENYVKVMDAEYPSDVKTVAIMMLGDLTRAEVHCSEWSYNPKQWTHHCLVVIYKEGWARQARITIKRLRIEEGKVDKKTEKAVS